MRRLEACALLLALVAPLSAQARDQIRIVGSSTVYPFSTIVAEQLGRGGKFKTPIVESTGTGGGFKLFCAGVGVDTPDLEDASRRITQSEMNLCAQNGVKEIAEIKIGYDGIVVANSKKSPRQAFTLRQLFMALAKQVPGPNGHLVANPYKTWKDVDPSLPDLRIEVLGPPPTSGTRDAFAELVMEGGCKSFPDLKALKDKNEDEFKQVCHALREDGAYIEAGENDNLIVQKLVANPKAFGIFGYSFLEENQDKIQGSTIDGVAPEYDSIAQGRYPVSRPLFVYVKIAHVNSIPGIREFIAELTSEKAMGEDGYLAERGLIPGPSAERARERENASKLKPLERVEG
ncbi:MAG TPA: PstS family phosphate ABC transporter substrate-binding protein [Myxococcota bacterium]|nr:PstS family phosphate ABC transporter substrate-binding protein [Myxococcota bacterium]